MASSNGSGANRVQPVVGAILRQSRMVHPGWVRRVSGFRIWDVGMADAPGLLAHAGISGVATHAGARVARMQLAMIGTGIGVVAGCLFSAEFAAVLGIAGAGIGFFSVPAVLRSAAAARNAEMERHLSEMLEVVVMGLGSGLSFSRSFALYPRYFRNVLADSMSRVVIQWEMGLVTREEALRQLEGEFDSPLLSRVVGSMVRSLRFGTSIAESLEAVAIEARETHRARMEERVAKAAVKMMLPVGTLILPAMLLMVLGPVMLELVEGF
ncbi:MAG: type II secretion system F family protein [Coriobacteriia bacterium]|nr:type II secretion system F family protein [Coriobacteriia bacterium]